MKNFLENQIGVYTQHRQDILSGIVKQKKVDIMNILAYELIDTNNEIERLKNKLYELNNPPGSPEKNSQTILNQSPQKSKESKEN